MKIDSAWCGKRGVDYPCRFRENMSEERCGKCYYSHGYSWKPKRIEAVIDFINGYPVERIEKEDVLYWLTYAKEEKRDRDMEEAQLHGLH